MQLGPAPWPLRLLIGASRQRSAEALAHLVGGWVLVGSDFADDDDKWNYRTMSAQAVTEQTAEGGLLLLRDDFIVFPLRKAGPSFPDTFLVGRASSNDVCIRHPSVSKLHARVRRTDVGMELGDAGSSNGTWLQQVQLASGEWSTLRSGDFVCLGTVSFYALEPTHLHGLLRRFATGI